MHRLSAHVLLVGCAGLLLGMQGCSNRTATIAIGDDSAGARGGVVRDTDKPAGADVPFRLPDDASGTLLARVLPPTAPPGKLDNPKRAAPPLVPPPRLIEPVVDLPALMPDLPRLPEVVKRKPVRSESLLDESLEDSFVMPDVPSPPVFATGERTNIPSADSALPPPLPVMARPAPDRVSLEDATMDASTAVALKAGLPERTAPAPFQKISVPEPYENRRPLTISVPEEKPQPVVEGPRPPKKPQ